MLTYLFTHNLGFKAAATHSYVHSVNNRAVEQLPLTASHPPLSKSAVKTTSGRGYWPKLNKCILAKPFIYLPGVLRIQSSSHHKYVDGYNYDSTAGQLFNSSSTAVLPFHDIR